MPQDLRISYKLNREVQSLTPALRRYDIDGIRYLVGKTSDYRLAYHTDVDSQLMSEGTSIQPRYIVVPSSGMVETKADSRDGYLRRSPKAPKNQRTFQQYASWVMLNSMAAMDISYSLDLIGSKQLAYVPRVQQSDYCFAEGKGLDRDQLILDLFEISGFNQPIVREQPFRKYHFFDQPVWEVRPDGHNSAKPQILLFHPNGLWGLLEEEGKTIVSDPEADC